MVNEFIVWLNRSYNRFSQCSIILHLAASAAVKSELGFYIKCMLTIKMQANERRNPPLTTIYLCYSLAWPNNKSPCCVLTTM